MENNVTTVSISVKAGADLEGGPGGPWPTQNFWEKIIIIYYSVIRTRRETKRATKPDQTSAERLKKSIPNSASQPPGSSGRRRRPSCLGTFRPCLLHLQFSSPPASPCLPSPAGRSPDPEAMPLEQFASISSAATAARQHQSSQPEPNITACWHKIRLHSRART